MALIICEKPSQARNLKAAIGTQYGKIMAARGHLLRFQLPEEINPEWSEWGFEVLAPKGRFQFVPSDMDNSPLPEIIAAVKTADHVIIATDCDREGEGIGREILLYAGYQGRVSRAMFSAEDETTLKRAFAALEPASTYDRLYEAFYARAACDQIANLSLTRATTKALLPPGVRYVLGIGRVKTPTLGILCRREEELAAFKPRDFYEIRMDIEGASGEAALWHRPKGDARIFDTERAALLEKSAATWQGPVSVTTETKHQPPPSLFDLPALQKAASKWGWTAARTLEVAQALYEEHKITTYPRAETRYLPETAKNDAPALLASLRALDTYPIDDFEPSCRTRHFSDKGLRGASHHAVIPNVNTAKDFASILPRLSDDERRLFDIIALAYLAALAPDHVYDEAIVRADVPVNGETVAFGQRGRMTRTAGWKALYADSDDDAEDDDALTPLQDGESCNATGAEAVTKTTTPPSRYSEGALIDAMQHAHRFIEDDARRDRLKEAKGIGTPATRDQIIEGLKTQRMIEVQGKTLVPTESGMKLYRKLKEVAPRLIDPGETAEMEWRLDAVQAEEIAADEIVRETISHVTDTIAAIRQAQPLEIKATPTRKMVSFAESIAADKGIDLPKGYKTDSAICSAFIDANYEKREGDTPTDKQITFAETIAASANIELDDDTRSSSEKLSAWIDKNKDRMLQKLASDKQLEWIKKLVENDGKKAPKGYPDNVTAKDASAFLDKAFGKGKKKGKRK